LAHSKAGSTGFGPARGDQPVQTDTHVSFETRRT